MSEEIPSISTQNLSALPAILPLRKLCQSLAVLDSILCSSPEHRYFTFDANWQPDEMMAKMDNGSGDHYFFIFSPFGAILKGFDHESPVSPYQQLDEQIWPGIYDTVPPDLAMQLADPAIEQNDVTFCIWRQSGDSKWSIGDITFPETDREVADGSDWMLFALDGQPHTYHDWSQDYYDITYPLEAVEMIYRHEIVTEAMVKRLNPKCDWSRLEREMRSIGYPDRSE